MKNFGSIKNHFNSILADGIVTKDDTKKQLFQRYVKMIKENEILKTQFFVYTNLQEKIEDNREKALHFIQENLNLFSNINKKDILRANEKLAKLGGFKDTEQKDELHENISKLIFLKRSPNNVDFIVEGTAVILNHILGNKEIIKEDVIEFPSEMIAGIMVDKYNEHYSGIDESDKKIIKMLIESTDEEKNELYSEVVKECIVLVNENLSANNLETKEKLLNVKEKLLNNQRVGEDFVVDISKLLQLRDSLKMT